MNKRCIVNVATGHFYVGQQVASMFSFFGQPNFDGQNPILCELEGKYDGLYWQDIFPIPSRGHEQSPYGFKAHAIRQAYAKGYKSILWTDSPAMAQAMDIAPIFERIEYYGYYVMSHHDPLENWVGDTALKRFGMTREQLKGFHHRAIMGVTDPKILVDHADGNGLNNQRSNLRICNRSQNAANHNYTKKEWTTSKHFGVSWMPKAKRWRAYTTKNRKQISLGLYLREEDAAKAYNEGAIKYHGEFTKLNVIA